MPVRNEERGDAVLPGAIGIASLLLAFGSIYITKTLSETWGIAVGAVLQSSADGNTPISTLLQGATQQIDFLHQGILESYVLVVIGLGLLVASVLIFTRRREKSSESMRTYGLLHCAFTVVYILLYFIIFSVFSADFSGIYVYIIYFGMGLALIANVYLQYLVRQPSESARTQHMKHSISMNPNTPFSNVLNLQDQVFSNMSGHLRIIDKHFNTGALSNLHRLIAASTGNFTKISILTSREMLDSKFSENLSDFRAELTASGVGLDVRLMDDKDAVDQHERVMMDDKIAYKIPPFNIINKRSEHITKINFSEAQKRFAYLNGRAIKMENYAIKKARDNGGEPKPEPTAPPSNQQ